MVQQNGIKRPFSCKSFDLERPSLASVVCMVYFKAEAAASEVASSSWMTNSRRDLQNLKLNQLK